MKNWHWFLSTTRIACLAVGIIGASARAEDVTTTDGKTYKNIKLSSETPSDIKVIHDGGISLIPKKLLKPEFIALHELSPPPVTTEEPTSEDVLAKTLVTFKSTVASFTTKDGRTFNSSDITKIEPNGLRLTTAAGILKLKFSELKASTQTALNYDPEKASTYEAAMDVKRQQDAATAMRLANATSEVESFTSHLRLSLVQNIGKGWICSAEILRNRDVDVVTSRTGSPFAGPKVVYDTVSKTQTMTVGRIARIMVFGLPSFSSLPADLQSRRQWSGKVYSVGNFLSKSASTGIETTITAAHIDKAEAVRWLAKNGNSVFYEASGELTPPEEEVQSGNFSGTGFAITADGRIGTAAHVVKNASEIFVTINGLPRKAEVEAINDGGDVAILKVRGNPLKPLILAKASTLKIGSELFCVGYPLVSQLGKNAKLTKGNLNSLTGLADDPHSIQMSVQIQPGNSGGPVCDTTGRVIGIVSKTGSTIAGARGVAGAVPQNVNFAAKAEKLLDLAATIPGVKLPTTPDVVAQAEERVMKSTFLISVRVSK